MGLLREEFSEDQAISKLKRRVNTLVARVAGVSGTSGTSGNSGTSGTSGGAGTGGGSSYLVYTALLSQSGTDAPTIVSNGSGAGTPLINTIGDIVWTRNEPEPGISVEFLGTLSGAFPGGKTFISPPGGLNGNENTPFVFLARVDDNTVRLTNRNAVLATFDNFNNISIEIRVHP